MERSVECEGWREARSAALERLKEHAGKGLVDWDIEGFLFELNKRECLYTTSSCSGRVAVLVGVDVFDKHGSSIIEAWHDPGECRRSIVRYYSYMEPGRLAWLSLQPPILHLTVHDEHTAMRVVECASESGFIRACYKRAKPCGYHVAVAAHDKTHVFLPAPSHVVDGLCTVLEDYKERLKRLEECLLALDCL